MKHQRNKYRLQDAGRRARHCGSRGMTHVISRIAAAILLLAASGQADAADVTATDLMVAGRALSFMADPPSGAVRVGIVYAPSSPASAAEAERVSAMLAAGLHVGNLVLRPTRVPASGVAAADVELFFLTDGAGDSAAAAVAAAAQRKRIPCVTTDIREVQNGHCMLGVRSNPRVEILLNRAAAARSGIAFSTAFLLLITEL